MCLGPNDFWENFSGGKLSIILNGEKARPVASKNCVFKIISSVLGRVNDAALVELAGPSHLAGKPNGVLAAATMAAMELDYAQTVDSEEVRCILTTDAKSAFQSASRNNCYKVLCTDDILREDVAPFFAHVHKITQRIQWPVANMTLKPSAGFTQGDVNATKFYACNTASLVHGLQASAGEDATVVAVVDDITIMGTLEALASAEEARNDLQKPSNYLVNPDKEFIYTTKQEHVAAIQHALPGHNVVLLEDGTGFKVSGIPLGGDAFIREKLEENIAKTKETITKICKLGSAQDKLVLLTQCIPGRIQHLLAAVPPHLTRSYAGQHDKMLTEAVAETLDLGELTERDKLLMQRKVSQHGLGLRSMERNVEFLFLSGLIKSAKLIKRTFPNFEKILRYTLDCESGLGREAADCLTYLREVDNPKLQELLPTSLREAIDGTFKWEHDKIQRELDNITVTKHEGTFDLSRVSDQQDLANVNSTDTTVFTMIPRSSIFKISNEALQYAARQLLGKPQRRNHQRYCPNISESTGNTCGVLLDSRDIHLRTCRMNNIHHVKHEAIKHWFQDLARQAHIQTAPAPAVPELTSNAAPSHPQEISC